MIGVAVCRCHGSGFGRRNGRAGARRWCFGGVESHRDFDFDFDLIAG